MELEHTDVLGSTLPEIAAAKVGVAKPGTPVVVATQSSKAVENVVASEARKVDCGPILKVSSECQAAYRPMDPKGREGGRNRRSYIFKVGHGSSHPAREVEGLLPLPKFVIENFKTALVAATCLEEILNLEISDTDVGDALSNHQLTGRFQVLPGWAPGDSIVLDGAHTQISAENLGECFLPRRSSAK